MHLPSSAHTSSSSSSSTTGGGATSAFSALRLVPSLSSIIQCDSKNLGLELRLWEGSHPDFPALNLLRGSKEGTVWSWDPANTQEHTSQQTQFFRFQAVIAELQCYISDYHSSDTPPTPAGDALVSPTAPAGKHPYAPTVDHQAWIRRSKTPASAACNQIAHRFQTQNCETVYQMLTVKQARTAATLSPWEMQRNNQKKEQQKILRSVSRARPTTDGGSTFTATSTTATTAPKRKRATKTGVSLTSTEDIDAGLNFDPTAGARSVPISVERRGGGKRGRGNTVRFASAFSGEEGEAASFMEEEGEAANSMREEEVELEEKEEEEEGGGASAPAPASKDEDGEVGGGKEEGDLDFFSSAARKRAADNIRETIYIKIHKH